MADYTDGSYLTTQGLALITKLLASGSELTFVKATVGDGELPEGSAPQSMTALSHEIMDGSIASIKRQDDGQVSVSVQINSEKITTGFYATELGLWATDPDNGTILYAYLYIGNHPEYLRPAGETVNKIATFNLVTLVSDIDIVTATIDTDAFAKAEDLQNYAPKTHTHDASQLQYGSGTLADELGGYATEDEMEAYAAPLMHTHTVDDITDFEVGGSLTKTTTIPANAWTAGTVTDGKYYYQYTVSDADIIAGDLIIAVAADDASAAECATIHAVIQTAVGSFTLRSNAQHDVAINLQYEICHAAAADNGSEG